MGPTDETLAAYQDGVPDYLAASPAVSPVGALLDALVARLPPGARVLEVGSGPGLEADALEARGLRVDRTDATPAFVDRLRAQGHEARVLDVRTGDLGGPWDAVLANAVLLHLDRADAERALTAMAAAARWLAVTLKEGDGEAWSDAKLSSRRWFAYWREEPLRQVLARAGWDVVELWHVQGRVEPWLHVLAQRS